MRKLKDLLKSCCRCLFELIQATGFDVLPRHFYSEIPDIRELRRSRKWREAYTLAGIQGIGIEGQFEFVSRCAGGLADRLKKGDIHSAACRQNGVEGFGPVEADFLYAFIRTIQPRKIIQVGCGVSTAVMVMAAGESGYRADIVCVDPYPTDFLRRCAGKGDIRLIRDKAENMDVRTMADLDAGDLLFVDSTHTLRPGGEVPRLILEVLPRLPQGVRVHFHDIYFPYDYARGILSRDLFFPHESIFLQAFLSGNSRFAIEASLSMLHYADKPRLKRMLVNYRPSGDSDGLEHGLGDFPSSIYLKVIK